MTETMIVELVPRRRPATAGELADRTSTVGRLAALGLVEDPASGEVDTGVTDGWVARIGGLELPLFSYSVEPLEDGRVMVALMVVADQVTIAGPAAGGKPVTLTAAAPAGPAGADGKPKPPARPWGAPGEDPRAGIPGWRRVDDVDQDDPAGTTGGPA